MFILLVSLLQFMLRVLQLNMRINAETTHWANTHLEAFQKYLMCMWSPYKSPKSLWNM